MEKFAKFLTRVGQRIRLLRQQRGLSIESLAHESDLHPSYLSQVERGVKLPSLKSVHKLSAGLGITPACLLSVYDEEQRPLLAAEIQDLTQDRPAEELTEIITILKAVLALCDRPRH
jgi:transcriptional regulator with XRE-family HTH domain